LSNEVQTSSGGVPGTAPLSLEIVEARQAQAQSPTEDTGKPDPPSPACIGPDTGPALPGKGLKNAARFALVLASLAAGAIVLVLIRPRLLVHGAVIEDLTIARRSISIEISSPGALRATSVQNYGGPPGFGSYWQFQIVNLVPEGKNVKKGDTLISFDAQKINQDLQQFQNELEQANKELEKTRVQIDLDREDLAAKLAEAENKYAMLKLKQSPFPELARSNDLEADKLALEEARREVESIKEWIAWQKKSSDATYKIIESKKTRAELKVAEIKKALENFQARADRDGVAVYKLKWNGDRFQVGENVWTGQPIIEIPDLNTIIAEAFIPEVDIGKLKIGQRAEVAVDALPGKSYSGHITGIGRLVHSKSWDIPNRILEAQIALDQLDTSIMRPAMSIKVKIETESLPDVIAVPLRSLHQAGDGWLVKVNSNGEWRDRPVRLGASNATDVVVTEGLTEGERIATEYGKAR